MKKLNHLSVPFCFALPFSLNEKSSHDTPRAVSLVIPQRPHPAKMVTIWEPNHRLCAFTKQTKINQAWNEQIANTTTVGLTYTKEMLWAATRFGKDLIKSTILYWTLAYTFWFLSSFNLLLLATLTSYFDHTLDYPCGLRARTLLSCSLDPPKASLYHEFVKLLSSPDYSPDY